MRSLRLFVFMVAFALVGVSFTAAAVHAEGVTGSVKSSRGKKKDAEHGKSHEAPDQTREDEPEPSPGEPSPGEPSPGEPIAVPEKPGDAEDVALPSPPVLSESLGAVTQSGDVKVKLPGEDDFRALGPAETIPMGSTVDATDGLAEIVVTADAAGTLQNAVVTGSVFKVDQFAPAGATPLTDLVLKGGDFSGCAKSDTAVGASKSSPKARAAARKRTRGGVVRGLWAAAKGRFRTRGRHSAATVRGTRWATVDRCRSTTTKVLDGVVDVMDFDLDKVFTVRAGERHVAREPGA